ncbi:MAG: hypothetical protein QXL94_01735 [Candidatus Parvarchaeum sp.]
MKDVEVYISERLAERLKEDELELMEFFSKLYGIFGTWARVVSYEPFKDKKELKGEELVKYKIPEKFGMIIGMKKLCNHYGADNIHYAMPGRNVANEGFISVNKIVGKMFETYLKEVKSLE